MVDNGDEILARSLLSLETRGQNLWFRSHGNILMFVQISAQYNGVLLYLFNEAIILNGNGIVHSCCLKYLKHGQECFIRYIKHESTVECFISDKARTASVLNGLKNDPSYEFIAGRRNVKNQRCLSRES
jgi:hypothetical protein